jgi:hypothetical protein
MDANTNFKVYTLYRRAYYLSKWHGINTPAHLPTLEHQTHSARDPLCGPGPQALPTNHPGQGTT